MKGFPKSLNSHADVLNLKESHPAELKTYLQDILNHKDQWLMVSKLDPTDTGLVSDVFKVVENTDTVTGEVTERYQYEYREDENCYIFRLGFETSVLAQSFVDGL